MKFLSNSKIILNWNFHSNEKQNFYQTITQWTTISAQLIWKREGETAKFTSSSSRSYFIVPESLLVQNVPSITFNLSEDGVRVGRSSDDWRWDVGRSHISWWHDWSGGIRISEVSVIAALVDGWWNDTRDKWSGISQNLGLWISLWFRGSAGHGDDCENNDLKK